MAGDSRAANQRSASQSKSCGQRHLHLRPIEGRADTADRGQRTALLAIRRRSNRRSNSDSKLGSDREKKSMPIAGSPHPCRTGIKENVVVDRSCHVFLVFPVMPYLGLDDAALRTSGGGGTTTVSRLTEVRPERLLRHSAPATNAGEFERLPTSKPEDPRRQSWERRRPGFHEGPETAGLSTNLIA